MAYPDVQRKEPVCARVPANIGPTPSTQPDNVARIAEKPPSLGSRQEDATLASCSPAEGYGTAGSDMAPQLVLPDEIWHAIAAEIATVRGKGDAAVTTAAKALLPFAVVCWNFHDVTREVIGKMPVGAFYSEFEFRRLIAEDFLARDIFPEHVNLVSNARKVGQVCQRYKAISLPLQPSELSQWGNVFETILDNTHWTTCRLTFADTVTSDAYPGTAYRENIHRHAAIELGKLFSESASRISSAAERGCRIDLRIRELAIKKPFFKLFARQTGFAAIFSSLSFDTEALYSNALALLAQGLTGSSGLRHLGLKGMPIDAGQFGMLCKALQTVDTFESLCIPEAAMSSENLVAVSELLQNHAVPIRVRYSKS